MRREPLVLWASLLGLCVLVAYRTRTACSRPASDKKLVILDLAPDEVTTLRLETEGKTVEVMRAESEWWVVLTDRPSLPKTTHGNDAAASEAALAEPDAQLRVVREPEVWPQSLEPVPLEFLANQSACELVARFAHFEAVRDLGALPRERVGEFGFEFPKKRLTVIYENGRESFDVGGRATESAHVYLRRSSDGRVYVVWRDPLLELEDSEESLLDRRLHGFAFSDIDRAIVIAGARRRELVRRAGEDAAPLWVDAAAPAEPNELYERWLREAHQLDVRELLPFETGAESSTPLVTIEYYRGQEKQGQLELRWEPASQGGTGHFRARSEHTLRWARVADAAAQAVARDLDGVLSP